MSLTRDAMYRLFEEAPGDLAAYGAMADELDESGWAALAHAYRWMMKRRKWPHKRANYADPVSGRTGRKVPAKYRWAWYALDALGHREDVVLGVYPAAQLSHHSLSPLILSGDQRVYASHAAAVMDLAKWLNELREAYDVDEPKRGL